jgi:hypothetical protein
MYFFTLYIFFFIGYVSYCAVLQGKLVVLSYLIHGIQIFPEHWLIASAGPVRCKITLEMNAHPIHHPTLPDAVHLCHMVQDIFTL